MSTHQIHIASPIIIKHSKLVVFTKLPVSSYELISCIFFFKSKLNMVDINNSSTQEVEAVCLKLAWTTQEAPSQNKANPNSFISVLKKLKA